MNITKINLANFNSCKPKTSLIHFGLFRKSENDYFVKTQTFEEKEKYEERQCALALKLDKKRKFDINDYRELTIQQKEILNNNFGPKIEKIVDDNIYVAELLKKYLDDLYGENNYIFASIGTSPSGIARYMEFCGVETKYFPASGLKQKLLFFQQELYENQEGVQKYLEFLKSQGISKEDVEKSDKKILFFDFCYTGNTLRNFEALLKGEAGIPDDDKTDFIDISKALTIAGRKYNKDYNIIKDYCNYYLMNSQISLVSGISHLPINQFKNLDKILEEETKKYAKVYNFILMQKLDEQGKLKENPLNKNSL